ncbi:CRISPR-associated helicase Cas3' [Streptomyces sp. NPDC003077]|uniref:CRISPR-associated helicase Cas3' n=1 Tax=Streptomyces sp. NPDC003077 TaxID=3154443 RepID=UPI0033B5114B
MSSSPPPHPIPPPSDEDPPPIPPDTEPSHPLPPNTEPFAPRPPDAEPFPPHPWDEEPFDPRLWGKERGLDGRPYPLGCHALDAGAMAGFLWDRYLGPCRRRAIATGWGLSDADARRFVGCLAGLHDLGKITPGFQACVPTADLLTGAPGYPPADPASSTPRHERATHLALPELLHRLCGLPLDDRPSKAVAHQLGQLLGGHHGVYPLPLTSVEMAEPQGKVRGLGGAGWDTQRAGLVRLVHAVFGPPVHPSRPAPVPVATITTGLVVLADWLVSQPSWIRGRRRGWEQDDAGDWRAHVRRARRAAPGTLREAQLAPPSWRRIKDFAELLPGLRPYPIQADLAARLPALIHGGAGLLLITAPTGEGKTEAAWYAERVMGPAAGTHGLAFLLPTMATTDAMWARVREHARTHCRTPPPVTLLHALARLDAVYTPDDLRSATRDPGTVTEWLRGRHRGFLGGVAVGTWDQAALAVLPHRFMAVRWLGLSGKTVVIDEVHAYDAYGHALTLRLLQWLGALGVPVVLLSATVTGTTAAALVHAYRHGAGHPDSPDFSPGYPGWVYADHATGALTSSGTLSAARPRTLALHTVHRVHTHDPDRPEGRARAVLDLLDPLRRTASGCALLVCDTVADAQATHDLLASAWGASARPPLVRLLHARMPARQRAGVVRRVQRWTGPGGRRPARPFVLVTTQVAEQSLDVDFDLVISDLAPLALLLQRAGRVHRHPRTDRPAWAPTPRLVVLTPTGRLPPDAWGDVYSASLLRRTRSLLATLTGPIRVPGDVQRLVDQVYGPEFAADDDIGRIADDARRAAEATVRSIPPPGTTALHPLTDGNQHADELVTRLGADGLRALPTYLTPDGRQWLHPTHHTRRTALPGRVDPTDRRTVRRLLHATVPVPAPWLTGRGPASDPPEAWSDVPGLRDLVLLPQPVTRAGVSPFRVGSTALRLDPRLGLVRG